MRTSAVMQHDYERVPRGAWEHFFIEGKIFQVIPDNPRRQRHTKGPTFRRLVVVEPGPTSSKCLAIKTYEGKATTRPDVRPKQNEHAIIYTGWHPPSALRGEDNLRHPIRAEPDSHADSLSQLARVNYGQIYVVEHTERVCGLGNVADQSLPRFVQDFREVNGLSGEPLASRSSQPGNTNTLRRDAPSLQEDRSEITTSVAADQSDQTENTDQTDASDDAVDPIVIRPQDSDEDQPDKPGILSPQDEPAEGEATEDLMTPEEPEKQAQANIQPETQQLNVAVKQEATIQDTQRPPVKDEEISEEPKDETSTRLNVEDTQQIQSEGPSIQARDAPPECAPESAQTPPLTFASGEGCPAPIIPLSQIEVPDGLVGNGEMGETDLPIPVEPEQAHQPGPEIQPHAIPQPQPPPSLFLRGTGRPRKKLDTTVPGRRDSVMTNSPDGQVEQTPVQEPPQPGVFASPSSEPTVQLSSQANGPSVPVSPDAEGGVSPSSHVPPTQPEPPVEPAVLHPMDQNRTADPAIPEQPAPRHRTEPSPRTPTVEEEEEVSLGFDDTPRPTSCNASSSRRRSHTSHMRVPPLDTTSTAGPTRNAHSAEQPRHQTYSRATYPFPEASHAYYPGYGSVPRPMPTTYASSPHVPYTHGQQYYPPEFQSFHNFSHLPFEGGYNFSQTSSEVSNSSQTTRSDDVVNRDVVFFDPQSSVRTVLRALLDTGAAYNFIREDKAEEVGLQMLPYRGLPVELGNGQTTSPQFFVSGRWRFWHRGKTTWTDSFVVLPDLPYDVIIGRELIFQRSYLLPNADLNVLGLQPLSNEERKALREAEEHKAEVNRKLEAEAKQKMKQQRAEKREKRRKEQQKQQEEENHAGDSGDEKFYECEG